MTRWLVGATMALLATSQASANSMLPVPVIVRTFNYAKVADDELARARRAADAIFREAGIELRWIECRVPQTAGGAPCTEPLAERGDLLLRLVDEPAIERSQPERISALGTSMLDSDQRSGVLITIDLTPVRSVAESASIETAALLGRAIAHEVGHLLLGTGRHPRSGLMRALWSHDELSGRKPASWRFSAPEAARIRENLVSRRAAN